LSRKLDPDLLLRAYAAGVFPMADNRDAPDVFWVEPQKRGVLPLDGFHLPARLGACSGRNASRSPPTAPSPR
jgi:leucyl/phenylalanyl-tRNA--protein transferase